MKTKERVFVRMTSAFGPGITLLLFIAALASVSAGDPREIGYFNAIVPEAYAQAPFSTLPQPAMNTVQCSTDGTKATLSWGAVSGAGAYPVRADDPSKTCGSLPSGLNNTGCVSGQEYIGGNPGSNTATSVTLNVKPGTPYTWWVHAAYANTWQGISPATQKSFVCNSTAQVPPPASSGLAVSCNVAGTQAVLSWSPSAGATNYWFRATGVSQSDCASKGAGWQWLSANGINYCYPNPDTAPNTTSVTFPTTPGTTYAWSVTPSNTIGYGAGAASSVTCTAAPVGAQVATLSNSSVAANWMVKDVCVNANNKPTSADPYYVCPSGTTRRKIQVGDAVPYHNIDQGRWQQSDSFPLLDASSQPLYFHTFDFPPFNQFNTYDGADGYDVYTTRDGYFSASNTADGGGFRTTFYGANCTFGSGWVFFPLTNFLSGGERSIPISGVYWEQAGQAPPGNCPSGYANSLTTWKLQTNAEFGGLFGNPIKKMNAIVSWHGFEDNANFTANGHLEVFYFTQQYGLTKWEVWTPVEQGKTKAYYCAGSDIVTYHNKQFVIESCRDWSATVPETTPRIPQWPLSNANMLKFWHFNDGGLLDNSTATGAWHRFGNSPAGNLMNWSALNSKSALDTQYNSVGVRYLAINCAAGADGVCGAPGSQALYQDLPASSFTNNGTYLYGVSAKTEGGTGTLQVAIQVISSTGAVLWQDVTQDTIAQVNGTAPAANAGTSVYLSSKFIGKTVKIPLGSRASKVRFLVLPITSQTFDLLDAWVNPFPAMK